MADEEHPAEQAEELHGLAVLDRARRLQLRVERHRERVVPEPAQQAHHVRDADRAVDASEVVGVHHRGGADERDGERAHNVDVQYALRRVVPLDRLPVRDELARASEERGVQIDRDVDEQQHDKEHIEHDRPGGEAVGIPAAEGGVDGDDERDVALHHVHDHPPSKPLAFERHHDAHDAREEVSRLVAEVENARPG